LYISFYIYFLFSSLKRFETTFQNKENNTSCHEESLLLDTTKKLKKKPQPLQEVMGLFDNLSLSNHSTPIVTTAVDSPKSNSGTPLKKLERLSSSEYS